jgi:hypothetical protein
MPLLTRVKSYLSAVKSSRLEAGAELPVWNSLGGYIRTTMIALKIDHISHCRVISLYAQKESNLTLDCVRCFFIAITDVHCMIGTRFYI